MVRFSYGSCTKRFQRFQFLVPKVPLGKGPLSTSVEFEQKGTVLVLVGS